MGRFADGVDHFGSGDSLCLEDVWNYVDWCKVRWVEEIVREEIKMKMLERATKKPD